MGAEKSLLEKFPLATRQTLRPIQAR